MTDLIPPVNPVTAAILALCAAATGLAVLAKRYLAKKMKAELRRESDARLLKLERRVRRVVVAQRALKVSNDALAVVVNETKTACTDTSDCLSTTREEMKLLTGEVGGLGRSVQDAIAWMRKLVPGAS